MSYIEKWCFLNYDVGKSRIKFFTSSIESYINKFFSHYFFKYSFHDLIFSTFFKFIYSLLTWEMLFKTIFLLIITLIIYVVIDKWIDWRVKQTLATPIQALNSVFTSLTITNHISISQSKFNNSNNVENFIMTTPDKYDGLTSFRVWLESFDRYVEDIPNVRRQDALRNSLSIDLQKKFEAIGVSNDANRAFNELRDALSANYDRETTTTEPIYELSKRVQFARWIKAFMSQALPVDTIEFSNKLAPAQFKNSLRNAWIKEKVLLLQNNNLDELVEEALRTEQVYKKLYLHAPNLSKRIVNVIQCEQYPFENEQQLFDSNQSRSNSQNSNFNERSNNNSSDWTTSAFDFSKQPN